jgi:hypothetical protein
MLIITIMFRKKSIGFMLSVNVSLIFGLTTVKSYHHDMLHRITRSFIIGTVHVILLASTNQGDLFRQET